MPRKGHKRRQGNHPSEHANDDVTTWAEADAEKDKNQPFALPAEPNEEALAQHFSKVVTPRGIVARGTKNQSDLIDSIRQYTCSLAIGTPGTGKTFLIVAAGVEMLEDPGNEIDKLVITRPAVNAGGEDHGFLPGDKDEKSAPYMGPVQDNLEKVLGEEGLASYREQGIIDFRALAYMRGADFQNTFVICDEGQNLNYAQAKMLFTRIGQNSKLVIGGDIEQFDLPGDKSDLEKAHDIMKSDDDFNRQDLTYQDVVRGDFAGRAARRFAEYEEKMKNGPS